MIVHELMPPVPRDTAPHQSNEGLETTNIDLTY